MENAATIIDSLANLLWPLIVIFILFIFRKSVESLINSAANGRKFSVKIGEMEISMDELSKQQAMMIADLQKRVNELQRKVEGGTAVLETALEEAPLTENLERDLVRMTEAPDEDFEVDDDISSILWVDDHPTNNALLIDSLRKQGVKVIPAQSTQEALELFKETPFSCVISDSCRHEGKVLDNCEAGIQLARKLREINDEMPIYLYTDKANPQLKKEAENAGATAVTSSPSELMKFLRD